MTPCPSCCPQCHSASTKLLLPIEAHTQVPSFLWEEQPLPKSPQKAKGPSTAEANRSLPQTFTSHKPMAIQHKQSHSRILLGRVGAVDSWGKDRQHLQGPGEPPQPLPVLSRLEGWVQWVAEGREPALPGSWSPHSCSTSRTDCPHDLNL